MPAGVQCGLQCGGGREDGFTEHDERETPVPLDDVVRVPGGPGAQLGPHRHGELGQTEDDERPQRPGRRQREPGHPADLYHGDADREAQRGRPARRVAVRGAQPLRDKGQPHDDVPRCDDPEVAVLGGPGDPGREDQYPADLDEGGQPVHRVVGVVGGGEPGEVDPRPPDREEHRYVPEHPLPDVPGGQVVVQLRRGARDRHREAQVEQQFQRGRHAVGLAGVARDHPCIPVSGPGFRHACDHPSRARRRPAPGAH